MGEPFITDPLFYLLAVPVVLWVGVSKGGFGGGAGMVAVPFLSLSVPLPLAAGILLPILCVMDLFALAAYRGQYSAPNLRRLLPAALVGIGGGALAFGTLDDRWLRALVGAIAVAFAVQWLLGATSRPGRPPAPRPPERRPLLPDHLPPPPGHRPQADRRGPRLRRLALQSSAIVAGLPMPRPHARSLLLAIAAVAAAMLGLGLLLSLADLARAAAGPGLIRPLEPEDARYLNGLVARNLNQILGVVFLTVAIAVPLTANTYSVKFLDFFIRDPVNLGVLGFVVFAAFENTWAAYLVRRGFVPSFLVHLGFVLLLLAYATVLPYLYYVFRFLHPNTLLHRLENQVESALASALRRPTRLTRDRARVAEGLEHIASVAIRSLERSDRSTAIESAAALERLAREYWRVKERLAPGWFRAEPQLFLGFSSAAVDELSDSRIWVEMKLLTKLRSIMAVAIPRTHDLASSLAKTLRRLGLEPQASSDLAMREVVTEFFNTFVRMALVARDPRTVFIVFDQYRLFAAALNSRHPALALEIAFYFAYYGRIAREAGLDFVAEVAAHDLGKLVRAAWESEAPNRQKLLDRFLQFEANARPPLVGVKKAHAILASYFALVGLAEPARQVRESLAGLSPEVVEKLRDDLLHVRREKYWEVNERRMNLDYVPPEQREILRRLLDELSPPRPAEASSPAS